MASVISKFAITPSFMGRMAMMFSGVLPTMALASEPTASTCFESFWTVTTEGSRRAIPLPFT